MSLATILTLSNLITPSSAEALDENFPPTSIIVQISPDRTSEAEVNQLENHLVGQWQLTGVSYFPVTVVFTPQGNGFVLISAVAFGDQIKPIAYEFRYTINNTNQPLSIDLELPEEEPIKTIFDFTSDGRIRVELLGVRPGEPRPTEFTTGALVCATDTPSMTPPDRPTFENRSPGLAVLVNTLNLAVFPNLESLDNIKSLINNHFFGFLLP